MPEDYREMHKNMLVKSVLSQPKTKTKKTSYLSQGLSGVVLPNVGKSPTSSESESCSDSSEQDDSDGQNIFEEFNPRKRKKNKKKQ